MTMFCHFTRVRSGVRYRSATKRTVRAFSPRLEARGSETPARYFALKIIECPSIPASRTSPPAAARLHVPTNADLTRYSAISVLARKTRADDHVLSLRTCPKRRSLSLRAQRTVRAFSPPLDARGSETPARYFALKITECPPTAASPTSPPGCRPPPRAHQCHPHSVFRCSRSWNVADFVKYMPVPFFASRDLPRHPSSIFSAIIGSNSSRKSPISNLASSKSPVQIPLCVVALCVLGPRTSPRKVNPIDAPNQPRPTDYQTPAPSADLGGWPIPADARACRRRV